ncbi:nf kappa B inhibitor I-kappa-B [Aspergillus flavus]|nr:nf kappa B inhibitor I-kappa-B [Aspergillus flavus]
MTGNQEAKIARRRAKNREAQRRHREATKAKLAELERLRPQVDSKNPFLPSSPYQAAWGLNETPSESPPASLDFQDFDFALPTNEENSVLDPHQWYSLGESLPPNASGDYSGTTASSVEETSRRHRAKSTSLNPPHARSESSGRSALHLAAASGNIECVRALLTHNADMNATDALGRTPLHACAAAGNTADHVSVAQMLIENGASPTLKDHTGMGPLHIAAERGNDRVLEALIRIGVDVNDSIVSEKQSVHIPLGT